MAKTTGEIIVDRLIDWGVDTIFGLPGDGINGIFEALRVAQEKIRFIQVRHEESAAFMACAYAKFTGRLGVCMATSGPGAIHLLNGLYDAKLDHAPVLAITGQTYHDQLGTQFQQEVDLLGLFKDVARYNQMVLGGRHAHTLVDVACRSALDSRSVSHLTIPVDVQDWEASEDPKSKMFVPSMTSGEWRPKIVVPQADTLKAAADLLNAGKRVTILAGQGAMNAGDELEQLAETLGAPVIKALLGKAVIPDDSPYTTGGIGLLGTLPSDKAMQGCDTLFMVGTGMPYLTWYPKPGQVRAVQLDIDPLRLGLRYPIEVGLVGDARATLRELIPMLQRKQDRSFFQDVMSHREGWNERMHAYEVMEDEPVKPQVVAHQVSELLRDDAIVTTDSGTITTWAARHIKMRKGMKFSLSGTLATMAPALPYAIGAQVAFPDRQVVAFAGDGSFTQLMGDFATAVKYDLPIKVVIIKNNYLGQIKWEQIVFLGNPEYAVDLHPIDFAKFAEACGGEGYRCEKPDEVRPALEAAFRSKKPAIVEATVDPYTPPMPAQATPEQALNFAKGLVRGQPERGEIISTVIKDKVREMI
ncbi:thiamine pyrophosphate-dependent enzyme [Tautonia plasticadhaerens]|uniref:Thiamine pyrophosphate-containing protein YdaP n=1 Tax=Tautonia plasticadhaerens TaxID=2527974 RepID=A0A518GUX5_9BACT|nr:thiamine pyrophosphate-dependent enzyme [Tautonia plasticadhaerens]QDV32389.1 Putative thiamine pyrophosphate-containing protein YdaP [Tautonia plasticadhaerens]